MCSCTCPSASVRLVRSSHSGRYLQPLLLNEWSRLLTTMTVSRQDGEARGTVVSSEELNRRSGPQLMGISLFMSNPPRLHRSPSHTSHTHFSSGKYISPCLSSDVVRRCQAVQQPCRVQVWKQACIIDR